MHITTQYQISMTCATGSTPRTSFVTSVTSSSRSPWSSSSPPGPGFSFPPPDMVTVDKPNHFMFIFFCIICLFIYFSCFTYSQLAVSICFAYMQVYYALALSPFYRILYIIHLYYYIIHLLGVCYFFFFSAHITDDS